MPKVSLDDDALLALIYVSTGAPCAGTAAMNSGMVNKIDFSLVMILIDTIGVDGFVRLSFAGVDIHDR